jgi:GTP pyrophosphokinase
MKYLELVEKAGQYLPNKKLDLIEDAYHFAAEAHKGQKRKTGGPYIEHPLEVTFILAGLQLDADSLAAALLHDVLEDSQIPLKKIKEKFGTEIATLVDGVTKLGKLSLPVFEETERHPAPAARRLQAENLRKMLVAMAKDIRVVFIKLADRLHNMRTLKPLSLEKQHIIAAETLEIYAPLAHRLGIWELKWQLEDLAFRYLEPRRYCEVIELLDGRRSQREEFIKNVIDLIKKEFNHHGLKTDVSGRPKHIYSIYKKMEKYTALGKQFDDIYDLLAVRVLVSDVSDCYAAMGIVHSLWRPLPTAFDDFIANPKPNGYQALHTAVMCQGTTVLEVQIRTHEMHRIAEYGIAAHWRYKEGKKEDLHLEERIGWLRQLIDWHRELSGAEEFLESVKTDIFIDQVFVFTPRGEIKDLPTGSTPIDLAYRIHTELGHRCIGAKVNGRLVPLDYHLHNGDMVEILASKREKGPSRDWLRPHRGYIKTSHAREKIRQWFKKQERAENIERGREALEKEFKQMGIKPIDREVLSRQFKYNSADDFLAAIGYGGLTAHQVALKLADQEQQKKMVQVEIPQPSTSGVRVLGVGDLLTRLGQCCRPVPGDKIIGYITRFKGVTIHRQDCYNVVKEEDKDRLVRVEWGQETSLYPVSVQVEAGDRVGLIRDISTLVAEAKINITSMAVTEHKDGTTTVHLNMETKSLAQLSRILMLMEGVNGVISAARIGDEATAKGSPTD